MTEEEMERRIAEIAGCESCEVFGVVGLVDGAIKIVRHHLKLNTECVTAKELRAIADILDQVSKEPA